MCVCEGWGCLEKKKKLHGSRTIERHLTFSGWREDMSTSNFITAFQLSLTKAFFYLVCKNFHHIYGAESG